MKKLREERNGGRAKSALDLVQKAAERGGNTVPSILEAVKVYATIGEICGWLRAVYGEYREK